MYQKKINNNDNIKQGRGNGTKCIGLSIKLKKDCNVDCTNWDGRLIHTVSSLDVDYMLCETVPDKKTDKPRKFKLKADKDIAIITMKVAKINHQVKVKIVQFGVNLNKATTGHKLQGVSLNQMVVRSWN